MDENQQTANQNQSREENVSSQGGSDRTLKKEETLFSWRAPARPFKRRTKEFFTTVLAIGFLVSLILFFLEGAFPVAVVISIVFLVYVLSTVPPEEVGHKITNQGVYVAGSKRPWDEFLRFWITRRFENDLLVLETLSLPGRVEMVIFSQDKEKLRETIERYIPYEEAEPNFLDRGAAWLSKQVRLES